MPDSDDDIQFESFDNYFSNAPAASTPLAGTEPVLVFQGGTTKQVAANMVNRKRVLTADANFYVSTIGSDSNNGTNPITDAWATIGHGLTQIAEGIDFGGHNVILHIGAGTFAGVGHVPGMLGGGIMQIIGAGSANTIIDCTLSPTGDGFDFIAVQDVSWAFDKFKIQKDIFACIGMFCDGLNFFMYDLVGGTPADLNFAPGQAAVINDAQNVLLFGNNGGTYAIDGTFYTNGGPAIELSFNAMMQDLNTAWHFTNNPAFGTLAGSGNGFVTADFGGVYVGFSPTFVGSATGTLYIGFQGGMITTHTTAPAGMTLIEIDSMSFGNLNSNLNNAGRGAIIKSGLPAASDIPAGSEAVFKDTSGGGVYLAYNDAGTIKKVQLV